MVGQLQEGADGRAEGSKGRGAGGSCSLIMCALGWIPFGNFCLWECLY